jgi:3-hydroxybutyryl-CoA dehydrogenase
VSIERIGIAGAGTMGAGIAQVACLGRYDTYLHDPDPAALAAGEERLRDDLLKGAERKRWSRSEADAASARLRAVRRLEDLATCDLVVEAAPEDLELKRSLFGRLAEACGPETILATNTSSLSVTAIAAAVDRPERVCGMHFFNPPALMNLVEIVAGEATSEEVLEAATEVAERTGRTPVRAADAVGFLANRCARPFTLEALRLVGERVAPPAVVDRIVRVGGAYRMGPFELMDLVGVDVNLGVARSFFEQSGGEPRWRPHPLQERLVADGRLGRKSGRGWYAYGNGPHRDDDPDPPDPDPALVFPQGEERSPVVVTPGELRAHPVEGGSLASLAADEEAVGYLALPTLAEANLVELTGGSQTSAAAAEAVEAYFRGLGKHTIWVGDAPGLVLGRIVSQLVNEACFAVSERVGSSEDVDTALRLGFNHPRGPFEWGLAIGADRVLAILDALRRELGQDGYRAAPLLRRWAADGGA